MRRSRNITSNVILFISLIYLVLILNILCLRAQKMVVGISKVMQTDFEDAVSEVKKKP